MAKDKAAVEKSLKGKDVALRYFYLSFYNHPPILWIVLVKKLQYSKISVNIALTLFRYTIVCFFSLYDRYTPKFLGNII